MDEVVLWSRASKYVQEVVDKEWWEEDLKLVGKTALSIYSFTSHLTSTSHWT